MAAEYLRHRAARVAVVFASLNSVPAQRAKTLFSFLSFVDGTRSQKQAPEFPFLVWSVQFYLAGND